MYQSAFTNLVERTKPVPSSVPLKHAVLIEYTTSFSKHTRHAVSDHGEYAPSTPGAYVCGKSDRLNRR